MRTQHTVSGCAYLAFPSPTIPQFRPNYRAVPAYVLPEAFLQGTSVSVIMQKAVWLALNLSRFLTSLIYDGSFSSAAAVTVPIRDLFGWWYAAEFYRGGHYLADSLRGSVHWLTRS